MTRGISWIRSSELTEPLSAVHARTAVAGVQPGQRRVDYLACVTKAARGLLVLLGEGDLPELVGVECRFVE
ncbi:MAG: hypothetical protein JWO67_3282 [Streptosporangiaceae bacterium]|nr:hypothetical protein [Streptosporangiaceae bacterium]